MRKIAYIFDIDGVLCRGPTVITSAVKFLKNLAAQRIDFVLMTNGAGSTEVNKAKSLSKMFKTPIKSEQIVLSHTPMKKLASQFKAPLVIGRDVTSCKNIMKSYGFSNVITAENIHAYDRNIFPDFESKQVKPINPEIVDGIFCLQSPYHWDRDIQIISDLSYKFDPDIQMISDSSDIKIFSSCTDFEYSSNYELPRFGNGMFQRALESVLKPKPTIEMFGKPNLASYQYVAEIMPAEKYVCIGDNPDTDILGATNANQNLPQEWISILTTTGIYQRHQDCKNADFIVDNLLELEKNEFRF